MVFESSCPPITTFQRMANTETSINSAETVTPMTNCRSCVPRQMT